MTRKTDRGDQVGMRTRPLTAVSLSSIPMSKSAILREECLARRRQESQVQVMKAFEVDMMDRLDFDVGKRVACPMAKS